MALITSAFTTMVLITSEGARQEVRVEDTGRGREAAAALSSYPPLSACFPGPCSRSFLLPLPPTLRLSNQPSASLLPPRLSTCLLPWTPPWTAVQCAPPNRQNGPEHPGFWCRRAACVCCQVERWKTFDRAPLTCLLLIRAAPLPLGPHSQCPMS